MLLFTRSAGDFLLGLAMENKHSQNIPKFKSQEPSFSPTFTTRKAFPFRRTSTLALVVGLQMVQLRRPFRYPCGRAHAGMPLHGFRNSVIQQDLEDIINVEPDDVSVFQQNTHHPNNILISDLPAGIGNAPSTAPRFTGTTSGDASRTAPNQQGGDSCLYGLIICLYIYTNINVNIYIYIHIHYMLFNSAKHFYRVPYFFV